MNTFYADDLKIQNRTKVAAWGGKTRHVEELQLISTEKEN
jgi:hypothetical protein